jgi:tRNA pseudouridine38-40 synthase
MAHYQVILIYDGTDFFGFQRQEKVRTVQGVFELALHNIGWQGRNILAAGRTDAGVHASGQVITFELDWAHSDRDLQRALNANLPNDVSVKQIEIVDESFHPRYGALARQYQYRIICREYRQPLEERYAWRVWPSLNLDIMRAGAQHFLGTHDFAAFGSPLQPGGSTVRTVYQAEWNEAGHEYTFDIQGNAFLYHMVRRIVFFLVQIGQGKVDPKMVTTRLQKDDEERVQGLAPSCGLNLVKVIYSQQILDS